MSAKRHASLLVLLAVLLFLGAISAPAHARLPAFAGTYSAVGTGLVYPYGVAVDAAGDLFIADSYNNRVVEVPAGGGAQITVPTNGLNDPLGLAVDGAGNVFIADTYNNRVVKVAAVTGTQTTVVSGLNQPEGVAVDGAGNVFIADTYNSRVVEVPAGGGAQTTVGSGLSYPRGVAVDGMGNVFIADTYNNRVVEVPAGGGAQTTVGSGLKTPWGVAVDIGGDVFIADTGNDQVEEVTVGGSQSIVTSDLYNLTSLAVDGTGDLFVTIGGAGAVQEIQLVAVNFGNVNVCPGEQTVPAPCRLTLALYYSSAGNTVAGIRVLTQGESSQDFTLTDVADNPSNWNETVMVTFAPTAPGVRMGAVQLLDASGNVLTTTMIHGIGQGPAVAYGPGTLTAVPAIGLNAPYGLALDGAGDVFIADAYNNRVVEVRADGGAQITVGTGLSDPTGVAVDGAGNVFIADEGNSRVVEVPAACITDTCQVTVGSGLSNVFGVTVDGVGNVFIADSGNSRVVKVPAGINGVYGAQATVGSGLSAPRNVAVDGAGNVFIADSGNNRVVEVPANGGAQTTLSIGLKTPTGVAVDAAGNVFIADSGNNRLVRVGGGRQYIMLGGLNYPSGVAVDAVGDVYFTQQGLGNHAVKLVRSQPPTLSFASTPVGTTSSDSPSLVALQNIGNQPLNAVTPGLTLGTDFVQVAGPGTSPDCTSSFALTPAATCLLGISFEPQNVGDLTAEATFTDNALNFMPYASQSIALQGTGLPSSQATATTLMSSPNPSTYGGAVTITAIIFPQFGGQATGTVIFKDGSATLATVAVSGNAAILTTSRLTVANHSLTAVYGGDAHFTGSTSASLLQVVQRGPVVGTATALTSSVNPSIFGKPVIFTATVAPQSGGGIPTGKVTLYIGSTVLGTATLANAVVKITTTTLPAGPDSVTAAYAGDANYIGSTSAPVDQLVVASTTVALTSSPTSSAYGQTVVFSAKVTSPGSTPPNGETVTFEEGTIVLGTGTLSSGTATFSTSTLAVGTNLITAVYGGDAGFASSKSVVLKQVVTKASTGTSILSTVNPSSFAQSVTFVAIVPPQFTGTPTGTVTFKNGTTTLGTAALISGVASYTTAKLAVGTWSITAVYPGNTLFTASTSTALPQVVSQASTTTTLVSSLNPSTHGQAVTFTATAKVAGQYGGTISGTVTFQDGSTTLGTIAITAGAAKLTTSALASGAHSITATYNGSTNFAGSSVVLTQTVN